MIEQRVPSNVQPHTDPYLFDVWPHRPQPLPDECLSSYVLRLGELNGCSSVQQSLLQLFRERRNTKKSHVLLWEYAPADWGGLPSLTQLPISSLLNLTVTPLTQKFRTAAFKLCAGAGAGYHVHGLLHRHLQVCGLCLQEQSYVRRIWRFAEVVCCLKHRVLLTSCCPTCGHSLTSFGSKHHPLRCAACSTDLRNLTHPPAPDQILRQQQALQADLHFLLDPTISLTSQIRQEVSVINQTRDLLPLQLALKFRYLQHQSGLSTRQWSTVHDMRLQWIYRIHLGLRVPVTHYLTYLAALGYSWPQFAALTVPDSFGNVPHLELHICPTAGCINSFAPSPQNVRLHEDSPERGTARFMCNTCKCRFTRAYSGELRVPRITHDLTKKASIRRSKNEMAQAKQMALNGHSNRFIEECLHWSTSSANQLWISMGVLEQVRQARNECKRNNQLQRLAQAQAKVDAVLQDVIKPDCLVTAKSICRALNRSPSHIGNCPGLRPYVQNIVKNHNQVIRQRRRDHEVAWLQHILDTLHQHPELTSLKRIADTLTRSHRYLRSEYPEMVSQLLNAIHQRNASLLTQRTSLQLQQIDDAATRLINQGMNLQHHSILKEAQLSLAVKSSPEVCATLNKWTCGTSSMT